MTASTTTDALPSPTEQAPHHSHRTVSVETVAVAALAVLAYLVASRFELFEWFEGWSRAHESWNLDEVLVATLATTIALTAYSWRRARELRQEAERLRVAEASLAESTERYRSLFRLNPLAIVSIDVDGRFVESNDAAKALMGLHPGQLTGQHFSVLVDPEDREETERRFAGMLAGRAERFELTLPRTDGERIDLRITGVPIVVAGRVVGAYDLLEDVTTANRVSRELERATEAKSLFLANMSHEIRTPLTSVIAAAELLDETGLAPVQHELVARMCRSGDRLRALIDSILDFSAIEAGATHLVSTAYDPRGVLSDAATEGRRAARHKRLDFELHIDPSLPATLTGDPDRVLQVVMNLVENAVKFTESGSVVLAASAAGDDPESAQFTVTDTGIGLSAADRDAVFESFRQVDPTLTRRYGGSGLGLAICKNLVERMGGRIWVESEPGRGSTFAFRLPVRTPAGRVG